jgi:hypothetical protein
MAVTDVKLTPGLPGSYFGVFDVFASSATNGDLSNVLTLGHYDNMSIAFYGPTGGSSRLGIKGANMPSGPYIDLISVTGGSLIISNATGGQIFEVAGHPRCVKFSASAAVTKDMQSVLYISSHVSNMDWPGQLHNPLPTRAI